MAYHDLESRTDSERELTDFNQLQPDDNVGVHPEDCDAMNFFASGRDFESVYVNHKYTKKEREVLATYNSLDYLPPHSQVYCEWLKSQPPRFEWDRWIMMGMIGFVVGFIGFLMHQLIDVFAEIKWRTASRYIKTDVVISWVFVVGYSVAFAIISSVLVVFIRPSAGGSGIPELIGYLNGTVIRHIFNVKTMVIKFLSCVCAVSSGLPVGPEGPMIHLGSMIGAGLSQLQSATLGIDIPIFRRLRNSEDRRNFISAGAAAGVSSAFGAPVGGLLFSMEEVSSFWNMKLSWQTFFCCMVSTFTTDLLNSAFTAFRYEGDFGQFKTNKYILFNVTRQIDLNIIGIVPAVLLGILGGGFGSLFTFMNLKIQRTRRRLLSKIKYEFCQKVVRVCEPVFIMIVFGTISVLLPSLFDCTSYSCPVEADNSTSNCVFGANAGTNLERYKCSESKLVYAGGKYARNGSYNQVATLLFLTGEQAISHLFSRNTHFEFDLAPLAVVLVIYLILACWAAGTSISSGLVVPMLFIGGLYGRFIGRLMVEMFGVHTSGYWAWLDPGAFALLGAASFFGGVSRLTMSLTVIMVELTNDIQFLLLIMSSIMVAKWVGDFFTHPLYHALLEFKCIPFLDTEPIIIRDKTKNVSLELFKAKDVMTSPVITIGTKESVAHIAHILHSGDHSGFPVIKKISPENGDIFCGLITRHELSILLMNMQIFEDSRNSTASNTSGSSINYNEFCGSKLVHQDILKQLLETYIEQKEYENIYIDILPYMNCSAPSIQEQFSLHRAYIIFRSLGLRHMTVVNQQNQVMGIITRKDIMGFMLEERLNKVLYSSNGPYNNDGN